MLDKKFWLTINEHVVSKYRKHIFDPKNGGKQASDVYGNTYPEYKKNKKGVSEYAIKKQSGTMHRQHTKFKDSNAPVLSGDLLNDFQLRETTNEGFTFGTTSWGAKVKRLAQLGRVISDDTKAIPDNVKDYIMDEADNYSKKWWKRKGGGKNITIDIEV